MLEEYEELNYQLEKRVGELLDENERLNNIINELKVCNSDYYNQICTLTSKLSNINNFINDKKNAVPKHIIDFTNEILFDNNIKLGDKE